MGHDFTTVRMRRHVAEHARQLQRALQQKGIERLPEEVRHAFDEDAGGLSALTDASYHLLAKVLGVELEKSE